MTFWFCVLVSIFLIPVIMMVFGRAFSKKAPQKINRIFGFRTSMSMKNKDTWEFAHLLLGKIWLKCGVASLIVSVVPMLFVIGRSQETIENLGLVIMYLQLALLIVTVIIVEKALRNTFDKDGNRKN